MIAYKVVTKDRESCQVHDSDYCLKYKKNKITKSPKNTLGVFCFDTFYNAEIFKNILHKSFMILKVETIGKINKPKNIGHISLLKGFYTFKDDIYFRTNYIFCGTICCPAVKVLE